MTRKEFLISTIESRVKEADTIIGNASNQCSNLKIFFISFCWPATAALIVMFFELLYSDKCINWHLVAGIVTSFYLLLLGSALFSHYSFYSRQYRYRKVKDSLEALKEKLLFMEQVIDEDITFETVSSYYKSISKVSNYTNRKRTIIWKMIPDCLFYVIPILIIATTWMVLFFVGV